MAGNWKEPEFDFSELFSNEEDDECDADCASCDGCSDTEE